MAILASTSRSPGGPSMMGWMGAEEEEEAESEMGMSV